MVRYMFLMIFSMKLQTASSLVTKVMVPSLEYLDPIINVGLVFRC